MARVTERRSGLAVAGLPGAIRDYGARDLALLREDLAAKTGVGAAMG